MEDLVLDGAMPVNDMELEERGGLQKLKNADPKKEASERARAEYRIWFQAPCWFDEEVQTSIPRSMPMPTASSATNSLPSLCCCLAACCRNKMLTFLLPSGSNHTGHLKLFAIHGRSKEGLRGMFLGMDMRRWRRRSPLTRVS